MNILIINGSHRINGNTWRFSNFAKDVLSKKNHNVSLFNLAEENIEYCTGCLTCEEECGCVINDAFTNKIIPAIKESDLIIFATPTYYDMPTAMMLNYIARTNSLFQYFEDAPKNVACFHVGQAEIESLNFAHECLKEYFMILQFNEVGEPIMRIARDPDDLVLDEEIEKHILSWIE